MTLDQLCARPGAGRALLHLHRWLSQHGAFIVGNAFRGWVAAPWVQNAANDTTAFTMLAELCDVLQHMPNPEQLADRWLLLVVQEEAFHEVRDFLAIQAALREADKRLRTAGRGRLMTPSVELPMGYTVTIARFVQTLGLPCDNRLTLPDGTPYIGRQS